MKLDRKTRRKLSLLELKARSLTDALRSIRPIEDGVVSSAKLLVDALAASRELASALRVILNKPATADEERQAKALIAREKRAARRRAA